MTKNKKACRVDTLKMYTCDNESGVGNPLSIFVINVKQKVKQKNTHKKAVIPN